MFCFQLTMKITKKREVCKPAGFWKNKSKQKNTSDDEKIKKYQKWIFDVTQKNAKGIPRTESDIRLYLEMLKEIIFNHMFKHQFISVVRAKHVLDKLDLLKKKCEKSPEIKQVWEKLKTQFAYIVECEWESSTESDISIDYKGKEKSSSIIRNVPASPPENIFETIKRSSEETQHEEQVSQSLLSETYGLPKLILPTDPASGTSKLSVELPYSIPLQESIQSQNVSSSTDNLLDNFTQSNQLTEPISNSNDSPILEQLLTKPTLNSIKLNNPQKPLPYSVLSAQSKIARSSNQDLKKTRGVRAKKPSKTTVKQNLIDSQKLTVSPNTNCQLVNQIPATNLIPNKSQLPILKAPPNSSLSPPTSNILPDASPTPIPNAIPNLNALPAVVSPIPISNKLLSQEEADFDSCCYKWLNDINDIKIFGEVYRESYLNEEIDWDNDFK